MKHAEKLSCFGYSHLQHFKLTKYNLLMITASGCEK